MHEMETMKHQLYSYDTYTKKLLQVKDQQLNKL
jgi:hypothetical protein